VVEAARRTIEAGACRVICFQSETKLLARLQVDMFAKFSAWDFVIGNNCNREYYCARPFFGVFLPADYLCDY